VAAILLRSRIRRRRGSLGRSSSSSSMYCPTLPESLGPALGLRPRFFGLGDLGVAAGPFTSLEVSVFSRGKFRDRERRAGFCSASLLGTMADGGGKSLGMFGVELYWGGCIRAKGISCGKGEPPMASSKKEGPWA
jgi:hypothetical protein